MKMGIWGITIIVLGGLASSIGARAEREPRPVPTAFVFANPIPQKTFFLDPALSRQSRNLIKADLKVLGQLPVQPEAGGWFDQVFGGNTAQAAIGFLDDRINYFITSSIPLQDRILFSRLEATDIALNVGTALWMLQLRDPNKDLGFQLGAYRINPNSSRVGIVQIADAYGRNLSLISRLDTLLHEARHSDCTGGMTAEDLARLRGGELPNGAACGHFHAICPAGHPFAGLAACDGHLWGAYAIGGVYSATVAKSCRGCKERMIQEALISSSDSFSRLVTAEGDAFAEGMLRGEAGGPDTSSSLGAAPPGRRPDVESMPWLRQQGMN